MLEYAAMLHVSHYAPIYAGIIFAKAYFILLFGILSQGQKVTYFM